MATLLTPPVRVKCFVEEVLSRLFAVTRQEVVAKCRAPNVVLEIDQAVPEILKNCRAWIRSYWFVVGCRDREGGFYEDEDGCEDNEVEVQHGQVGLVMISRHYMSCLWRKKRKRCSLRPLNTFFFRKGDIDPVC